MITGSAKIAGVIGWPIKHSMSPILHNFWLRHHKIDGTYIPMAVEPKNLEGAIHALPLLGFQGVNITVPHKETALKAVDKIEPPADRIGAINTLNIDVSGKIIGSNTDGFGFLQNVYQNIPHWNFDGKIVTLIGAGGAARAILFALLESNVDEVRLINRTHKRAVELAEQAANQSIKVIKWHNIDNAIENSNLLVNTTVLGMKGQPSLILPLDRLAPGAIVNDIVYSPLKTPLLGQAMKMGIPTIDGIGMLLHQACPGFQSWFGVIPSVTKDLKAYVSSKISK